jgi:hypothetical protein
MTEREIERRVDRMLAHLDRLLLNRDMSEDDYHAAVLDLSEWEEKAMTELEAERRSMTDDKIRTTETQKPETLEGYIPCEDTY